MTGTDRALASSKSAQTRFDNDRTRAAQLAMGSFNQSATDSLRPTGGSVNRRRPNRVLPAGVPSQQSVANQAINTGQTPVSGPQAPAPSFDETTDRLLKQIRLEKFVGSPEVSDAVSKVNLQNYFNGKAPGPDYGARILDIVNTYIE